jgi:ATP citrate (pro-S)-lyase
VHPKYVQIRVIALIAEGVPENHTRRLIKLAAERGVTLIGPATVGGIMPGAFKIGNTGGMMDNILASKLYRPGRCVACAYYSRTYLNAQCGLRIALWWHVERAKQHNLT